MMLIGKEGTDLDGNVTQRAILSLDDEAWISRQSKFHGRISFSLKVLHDTHLLSLNVDLDVRDTNFRDVIDLEFPSEMPLE